jgi:hypothetical protein
MTRFLRSLESGIEYSSVRLAELRLQDEVPLVVLSARFSEELLGSAAREGEIWAGFFSRADFPVMCISEQDDVGSVFSKFFENVARNFEVTGEPPRASEFFEAWRSEGEDGSVELSVLAARLDGRLIVSQETSVSFLPGKRFSSRDFVRTEVTDDVGLLRSLIVLIQGEVETQQLRIERSSRQNERGEDSSDGVIYRYRGLIVSAPLSGEIASPAPIPGFGSFFRWLRSGQPSFERRSYLPWIDPRSFVSETMLRLDAKRLQIDSEGGASTVIELGHDGLPHTRLRAGDNPSRATLLTRRGSVEQLLRRASTKSP